MELSPNPFAILCYVAVAAGSFICLVAMRRYFEFRKVDTWDTTQGEIIDSGIRFSSSSSEGSLGDPRYHVHVLYRYEVGGKSYTSRRQVLAGRTTVFKNKAFAEGELIRNYAIGSKVRVLYNPRNPRNATLNSTVDNRVLALFFTAGLTISSFSTAAYGGLFARKDSWLANLSTPTLLIGLVLFATTIFVAFRSSGDVVMDKDQI